MGFSNKGTSVLQFRDLLLSGAILALTSAAAAQTVSDSGPSYVGSQRCISCHEEAGLDWKGSHHALAWSLPDNTTVLGDFDDREFQHKGVTTRLRRRGDAFLIETESLGGKHLEYEVVGVAGVKPLQQYLVEVEPGRLQALDVAWDVEAKRWYHLYPEQDLPPGNGLHWTGPYKNWNARCAECHATGFKKNYSTQTRTYTSSQAEIGVGCEACHGPGEAHVAWAEAPDSYDATNWPDLAEAGFTIEFSAFAPELEIQQCAGCHSRREPLLDGNPLPGTLFHDAYRLSLLREGLYYADGAIRDEVYVYGSFLQSKMYGKGVRCTDCHDPHLARVRAQGNAVCTQCHSPAGNPRFPSLTKAIYDSPEHHFHDAGAAGFACVDCHMTERVYMGIDGRRDHSFRIPRPDLSADISAPNACNDCHADRDSAWAAAEIKRRFPDGKWRGPHFSQGFALAWQDLESAQDILLDIAYEANLPAIVRASAIEHLTGAPSVGLAARTEPLLEDENPLVRGVAVAAQRGAPAPNRVKALAPLLNDPVKTVRIATAREMLNLPSNQLSPLAANAWQTAMEEWQASSLAKADFPETHLAMGGAALVMRNLQAAEAAFREAVRLDPQRVEAWTMIIRILAAVGNQAGARQASEDALLANPRNEVLLELSERLLSDP